MAAASRWTVQSEQPDSVVGLNRRDARRFERRFAARARSSGEKEGPANKQPLDVDVHKQSEERRVLWLFPVFALLNVFIQREACGEDQQLVRPIPTCTSIAPY